MAALSIKREPGDALSTSKQVYLGTDCGATTSKVGGVWGDGSTISTKLYQQPTNSHLGPAAVIQSWIDAADGFLAENGLSWDMVQGVGLAIPGPYKRYGVLERSANLPASFEGFDVHGGYSEALAKRAGRPLPLAVGNDGNFGGVAEAQRVRGDSTATVVMLAPGSGLGAAYVDSRGLPLEGDTLAGMEAGHMAAPLQMLDIKPYPCGCGRTWGCIEVYTSISGLPYVLAEKLAKYPDHELAKSALEPKKKVLALRDLAQKGDPLAVEIFDFQAKALGYHIVNLAMALDPQYFVIGGGLMDPEATTEAFRTRYLRIVRETAMPLFFPRQRETVQIVPAALGELSQAIGAALVALYQQQA
jgi:glucokinase